MGEGWQEAREDHAPRRGGPLRRAPLVLLVLLLIGLPLFVATDLTALRANAPAMRGEQPGGIILGVVRGRGAGPLEGQRVELFSTFAPKVLLAETRTDAGGHFELVAPPLSNAAYRLRTGGQAWQVVVHEAGFLTPEGEVLGGPLLHDFELEQGAILSIELLRDGRPVSEAGIAILRGEVREQGFMRLLPRRVELQQRFNGSPVQLEGLPALIGRVDLEFSGGQVVSFDIRLDLGTNPQKIEL